MFISDNRMGKNIPPARECVTAAGEYVRFCQYRLTAQHTCTGEHWTNVACYDESQFLLNRSLGVNLVPMLCRCGSSVPCVLVSRLVEVV